MTPQVIVVECGGCGLSFPGRFTDSAPSVCTITNKGNQFSPCQLYQEQFLIEKSKDILIYIHDDVTIHDDHWLESVLELFAMPQVAVVGLGGATSLGHPDLYKRPYNIWDMARSSYVSNQTDWAVHGGHETGSKRVAVIDAYFMAVRRNFLVECGGWPIKHLTHHALDLWLACEAARRGKEVWMTGCECTHHGGGTSVKPIYKEAKWLQGQSLEEDHARPHRWLYETYRDVLPIRV